MTEVSGDGQSIALARKESRAGTLASWIGEAVAAGSSTDSNTTCI